MPNSCGFDCTIANFAGYTGKAEGPSCCEGDRCAKLNLTDTIGLEWSPPVQIEHIERRSDGHLKVDRFNHPFFTGYLHNRFSNRACSIHRGIDVFAADGTEVLAVADGTVLRTSPNTVYIKHECDGKVYTSQYGHTKVHLVTPGQPVTRGTPIGRIDDKGHVHFEMYRREMRSMAPSSKLVFDANGVQLKPTEEQFPYHRILRREDRDLLDPFDILGPPESWTDASQQAAAKRLVFPLSFNLGPRQYDEQHFDFFASLNESAGEFGHFPIGRDLLWHGGIHLFHEENAPVFNVYAGRIVAAKLQRPGREDAEKPSNGFVIIRHVFSSAADEGNDGKPFYSLHMHLADEVLGESTVPWIMRIGEKYGKGVNLRTPNTTLSADAPQVLKDLCDGKYVVLSDEDGLDMILSVAAGEQIGRCHRVPAVGGVRVFGEHFEIFSAHDLLAGEMAADFSEIYAPEAPCKLVMRQKSFSRPDSCDNARPDMGKKSDNEKRNPAMNVACDVLGLHEYRGEKYAYVETESGKRWVLYQKGETIYGTLTALPQQKWYKITDAGNELKYDTASMGKVFDIITKADPDFSVPGGIIKRAEIERFYRANEKAKLFRFTYLDSVSEWSLDPARAIDDSRTQYLPKADADALKEELERFGLWKNLKGIEKLDGFAKSIEGGAVRHYRYHPVMFLWWLERTVGAICRMPELKSCSAGLAADRETIANNEIEDSVGVGGTNKAEDVMMVQRRLAG